MFAVPALSVSACGDDDDAGSGTTTEGGGQDGSGADDSAAGGQAVDGTLTVIAEDIAFGEDTYTARPGTVDFVYENVGNIRHTMLIESVDGFELEVNSLGDVDEGSVDLAPGDYTLYCDVPGHEAAGMVADLVVE